VRFDERRLGVGGFTGGLIYLIGGYDDLIRYVSQSRLDAARGGSGEG
jgi:hypothetical protein